MWKRKNVCLLLKGAFCLDSLPACLMGALSLALCGRCSRPPWRRLWTVPSVKPHGGMSCRDTLEREVHALRTQLPGQGGHERPWPRVLWDPRTPGWQGGLWCSRKGSVRSLWPKGHPRGGILKWPPVWVSSWCIDHTLRWSWSIWVSGFGKGKGNPWQHGFCESGIRGEWYRLFWGRNRLVGVYHHSPLPEAERVELCETADPAG